MNREHLQNYRYKKDTDGTKPDIAKRTQRLIPQVGILSEALFYYMTMLDADVTIVTKTHLLEAFLITTNLDFTEADLHGIMEDTSWWLHEPSSLLSYHRSQAASRRRRLGRNTILLDEKLCHTRASDCLPFQTEADLAPHQPQQDFRPPVASNRSYGFMIAQYST